MGGRRGGGSHRERKHSEARLEHRERRDGGAGKREPRDRRAGDRDREERRSSRRGHHDRDRSSREHRHERSHRDDRQEVAPVVNRLSSLERTIINRGEERRAGRLTQPEALDKAMPTWFLDHIKVAEPVPRVARGQTSFEPLRVPDACDRGRTMPMRQRVVVAASANSVQPGFFADPASFEAAPAAGAPGLMLSFPSWQDTTVREVLANVRRFFLEHPDRAPEWMSPASQCRCSVAAVFPGADGIASMAPLGTVSVEDGVTGDLDVIPLKRLARIAKTNTKPVATAPGLLERPAIDPATETPAAAVPRDAAVYGDILLLQPEAVVAVDAGAVLATPSASADDVKTA